MTRLRIPEPAYSDGRHRLGRHVNHDPRSLLYRTSEAPAQSIEWPRWIPILDQGQLGSCTGNALTGALGTGPLWTALGKLPAAPTLDESFAVSVYSDAERIDGGQGYPPEDQGSSGLSVAKVAKARGLVAGYRHATSLAELHGALAAGPVMIGAYWYTGMDTPTADGLVHPTGQVRGGHEWLCRGFDAAAGLFLADNSWGATWGRAGSFHLTDADMGRLLADGGDATSLVPATEPAPTPGPGGSGAYIVQAAAAAILDPWSARKHRAGNADAAAAWRTRELAQ